MQLWVFLNSLVDLSASLMTRNSKVTSKRHAFVFSSSLSWWKILGPSVSVSDIKRRKKGLKLDFLIKVSTCAMQFFSVMSLSPSLGSLHLILREMKSKERGLYLIHLLITCANHVVSGNLENANATLEQISVLASSDGDTMQRIAAYFTEAHTDQILKT
ncbi:hypothetical protein RJT34_22668 [Clitoria ternatea]|uniref:Uncharacterized protein n=1 Tax=Clitoria ternatea TaxID=43366 RepID=A0AAN9FTB3_CLITE